MGAEAKPRRKARIESRSHAPRTASLERATSESQITVSVHLDGTGEADVSTGVPFFDHILTAFARHSLTDLTVNATGVVHLDVDHTVEDTGSLLGAALLEALGDKSGISRYGDALVPLDEALAQAVVDICLLYTSRCV